MFGGADRPDQLFTAESALSASHTPDTIVGRDAEIEALEAALTPLTRRTAPENVVAYGPAGVGKTTTVTHVCNQLEAETRVRTVTINCWQYNTRSSLLSQLLIALGYPAPRKGRPIDELLRQLHEWVDKHQCLAIVLDEFDRHQAQTDIIYDLHHVSRDTDNELGVILISNQPPAELQLDPRSQSRLNYRPVHFARYDADGLHAILQDRADTAFHSDAVTDAALRRIADRVAGLSGDCRHAIELLHRAGRIAERAQAETVTRDHVEQSFNPARK
ncbi:Cdc6/Cdc18 family protein [Halobiforma nitratireducens]|uniref:Orc1-type DNA replication protein n=1 Tax=Halobiforma nitratireducens JCM 10879 TaxID=1227454 RepID=M0M165_9EURY|nr:AAA family ATPase [Halobiforma nitratireducens]EMA39163.1 Orc1-type DNA replication protein [Halobiforma nitratireducens JCM 10879]